MLEGPNLPHESLSQEGDVELIVHNSNQLPLVRYYREVLPIMLVPSVYSKFKFFFLPNSTHSF